MDACACGHAHAHATHIHTHARMHTHTHTLDLRFDLQPLPSIAQLTALRRGTVFRRFRQLSLEQRCSCVAAQALDAVSIGIAVSARGWEAVPDHEMSLLAVGVGRSYQRTKNNVTQNAARCFFTLTHSVFAMKTKAKLAR